MRTAAAALLLLATPVAAADKPKEPPPAPNPAVVQKLLDCRALTDSAARLACLDAGVAALAGAVESREVVMADKEQVRKARRGLFGLSLPRFNLFGGGDDDKDDKQDERGVVSEIEATLTSARQLRPGIWRFALDDDSVWVMTEGRAIPRDPRAGMKIRIRRAAAGSFLANVDGQIAVRVRRVID